MESYNIMKLERRRIVGFWGGCQNPAIDSKILYVAKVNTSFN